MNIEKERRGERVAAAAIVTKIRVVFGQVPPRIRVPTMFDADWRLPNDRPPGSLFPNEQRCLPIGRPGTGPELAAGTFIPARFDLSIGHCARLGLTGIGQENSTAN